MRYILFVILTVLLSTKGYSQQADFVGLHGIEDHEENLHFEYRGHKMSVYTLEGSIANIKTINQIVKNYQLGNIIKSYGINNATVLSKDHIVIDSEYSISDKSKISKTTFLSSIDDTNIQIFVFETINKRDLKLEYSLVKAYYENILNASIDRSSTAYNINLANKIIPFGAPYRWKGPNNITTISSEMAWSVFPTLKEANEDMKNRIARDLNSGMVVSLDENIDVLFIGIPSIAKVITFYPPNKQMPIDKYYIVQELNGSIISLELTNKIEPDGRRTLPYKLKEIVQFDDGPGYTDWLTERDFMEIDKRSGNKSEYATNDSHEGVPVGALRLGAFIPMGGLKSIYNLSPVFSTTFGYPFNNKYAIDFGLSFVFPQKTKHTDFYKDLNIEPYGLYDLFLRFRYQHRLNNNLYLSPYVGVGAQIATVDLNNQYEDEIYASSSTKTFFTAHTGLELRNKRFGLFVEYQYINADWKQAVDYDAKSAVTIGLSLNFCFVKEGGGLRF